MVVIALGVLAEQEGAHLHHLFPPLCQGRVPEGQERSVPPPLRKGRSGGVVEIALGVLAEQSAKRGRGMSMRKMVEIGVMN